MDKFIPENKLSKKVRKEIHAKKRVTWESISPVTRQPKSKKAYDRKKASQIEDDLNGLFFLCKIYGRVNLF